MKATKAAACSMLIVSLSERLDVDSLKQVASCIRLLPTVLRVRVDWDTRELEILHQYPTGELLQEAILHCCWRVIIERLENH